VCILEFSSSSNNSSLSLHRGVVKREAEAGFLTAADGDASVGTVLADDQEKTRTPLRTGGSGTEGTCERERGDDVMLTSSVTCGSFSRMQVTGLTEPYT
jgi:hypothetical protein